MITDDELRQLILALCADVAKMAGDPDRMILWIERIAELNAELKARREKK
jgi:hypothetical protein